MIQLDINMPKSCSRCFAYHEGSTYDQLPSRCEAMKNDGDYCGMPIKNINTFDEKPSWCPLKEVRTNRW